MKRLLLTIVLLCSFISTYAAEKIKIAVMKLERKASVDTTVLSEGLQAELAKFTKVFIVVEREKLNQVIKEQKLNLAGFTEEDAVQVGELLGAKLILSGTVSLIEGRYIITVKALDSTTGAVAWGDTVMSYDRSGLVDILPTLAHRISKLARGKKVRPFKLKPIKTISNQKKSPGYFSRLMSPPSRRFAWELGLLMGWVPGFADAASFGVLGGFHAPGESFFQAGLDLEVALGSLNQDTGSLNLSLSPTLGMSLIRTKMFQLHAGVMYQFHIRRISLSLLNTLWFSHHNVGLYADANLIFSRNWSLSLAWKYSLPVSLNLDASGFDTISRTQMGVPLIQSGNGLKYHSIGLNFNLYK